jgi:hypothetical protein
MFTDNAFRLLTELGTNKPLFVFPVPGPKFKLDVDVVVRLVAVPAIAGPLSVSVQLLGNGKAPFVSVRVPLMVIDPLGVSPPPPAVLVFETITLVKPPGELQMDISGFKLTGGVSAGHWLVKNTPPFLTYSTWLLAFTRTWNTSLVVYVPGGKTGAGAL